MTDADLADFVHDRNKALLSLDLAAKTRPRFTPNHKADRA